MGQHLSPDLCVIGAGAAGLSISAVASRLGASVVMIEAHRLGGECLHSGCVPSKALLAAGTDGLDLEAGYRAMRQAIDGLAPQDSVARFEALGVTVIQAEAHFSDERTVVAGDTTIAARRFVLATGSRPEIPAIPGLADGPYLTNETLFDRAPRIEHLLVLGGGPMGVELAQAYRHLGSRVTLLARRQVLARDDTELAAPVIAALEADGVEIIAHATMTRVDWRDGPIVTLASEHGPSRQIAGSHLLVATGRRAHVDGLGLEVAGIRASPKGIEVDARLRTSNRRVFAVGDAVGLHRFTHMAGHHAGVVIKNALFHLPAKVDHRAVPRVTYTTPELMQVGLTEAEARARFGRVEILRHPFAENDRAAIEGEEEGLVKLIVGPKGRLVGGGVVGVGAGELALPLSLVITRRLPLSALAGAIVPYPTRAEVLQRAASRHYAAKLLNPRTKRLVRLLARIF